MLQSLFKYALLFFVSAGFVVNIEGQKANTATKDSFRTADLFFLTPQKQLEYYQKADQLLSTNLIEAGKKKYPLTEAVVDLSNFSFKYKDTLRTVNDFMKQTNVVGLIIIRNDSILFERYRDGIGPKTKWVNFSVAKSVTSLLYGAAIQDGYIKSLDQKVSEFIPELKGSVYDSVSLHNLLQMSSGVAWNDDSRNPKSDLFRISRIEKEYGWKAALDSLADLKRAAPPGKRFNYNTIETILAGIILKNSIKKPLAQYLSERIWKPFGMHNNANWVKIRALNVENGGCCISATLRDYALLGLFAMKNGKALNGKQVLAKDWMQRSVTPTSSYKGYGYYWWLHPKNSRYFASGAFGQQIEIDPASNTVMAVQSYWPIAFSDYYIDYMDGFIEAMMNSLKIAR
jgi:CubicO group peptidase (beta-lactamase class C family)